MDMPAKISCRRSMVPQKIAAAIFLAFGFSSLAQADTDQLVQQLAGPAGHTIWLITRPTITQARTTYPQIQFSAGESVVVTASGCANPGGQGSTSTRYVDPLGNDAGMHHGQISIPGATQGLVSFTPAQPTWYEIPAGAQMGSPAYLTLGYVDDNYKDNGYKHHDNGSGNQCQNVNDATVTVDISPASSAGSAPATANYLFDVENVTIRHLRSKNNDTLDLSAGVMVNGTPSDVGNLSLGKLQAGSHAVNFPVLIDSVAPADRINIAYSGLNAGHPTDQKTVSLVTGIIGQIWQVVPVYGSLLGKVTDAIGSLINIANPDCDGPVVAGSVPATGTELFQMTHSGSTYRRTLSFPGVDSSAGCGGNSYYEVTYSVTPTTQLQPEAVVLKVDALTKAAAVGKRAILMRPAKAVPKG
jgi:hypothetical protein